MLYAQSENKQRIVKKFLDHGALVVVVGLLLNMISISINKSSFHKLYNCATIQHSQPVLGGIPVYS